MFVYYFLHFLASPCFPPSMMNDLSDYMDVKDVPLNVNDVTSIDVDMTEDDEQNEWTGLFQSYAAISNEVWRERSGHMNDAFVPMCTLADVR